MKPFLLLLTLLVLSRAVKLPHSFKICNRTQTDFQKCLLEAAEYNTHLLVHPHKDLRLPSLKPLLIPTLTVGAGKSAVAVQQHFKNCEIHGLDHVAYDKFDFNFEKKIIDVNCHFPEITKKCDYELNGKVLLLPIVGNGQSTLILKNVKLGGELNFEENKRKGKTYLRFLSHNFTFDVGHVYYHFDNLFNGDKNLGDTINKVLNENWKQVFDDVKEQYATVIKDIIVGLFNQFWGRVSVEEAFNPESRQ